MPAPENVKWYFQFLIHSAFAQLAVDIDQNLQRHRAVSLRQHGFLVIVELVDIFCLFARSKILHVSLSYIIWQIRLSFLLRPNRFWKDKRLSVHITTRLYESLVIATSCVEQRRGITNNKMLEAAFHRWQRKILYEYVGRTRPQMKMLYDPPARKC